MRLLPVHLPTGAQCGMHFTEVFYRLTEVISRSKKNQSNSTGLQPSFIHFTEGRGLGEGEGALMSRLEQNISSICRSVGLF